jgi:hypothetical protein
MPEALFTNYHEFPLLSWLDWDCNPTCIPVPEDQAAHLAMPECGCHLNLE